MQFAKPQWLPSVGSTNTYLREQLERGQTLPAGTVVATLDQTDGRGRYERKWHSGAGTDLAFSFLVWTAHLPERIPSLPMAVALAVTDLLAEMGIESVTKWPNDVLVGGRKICGILSERCDVAGRPEAAVIVGIGLNVNMTAAVAAAIDQPATSILLELGTHLNTGLGADPDPCETLDRCLSLLALRVEQWNAGGFLALRDDWIARCAFQGESVTVRGGDRPRTGTLSGFGPHGELLLQAADGSISPVWSGDILPRQDR